MLMSLATMPGLQRGQPNVDMFPQQPQEENLLAHAFSLIKTHTGVSSLSKSAANLQVINLPNSFNML